MKRILVTALLFISFTATAQKSFESIQKAMELFDKEDYAGTIRVAENALETVKIEFGETSPFYSGLVFFLAFSHFRLYHFEKAEPYFIKQLELVAKSSGENNLNYIACLNGTALLYREMGKFSQSEFYYNKALTITKSMVGVNDTVYAKGLNNQASLYQFMGQYAKAEQIFIQSRDIMKRAAGENSAMYATSLNNLATLYADMGQYPKAKPILLNVIAIRKAVLGESHPDYAGALNNLASLLTSMGEYKEAERYFINANDLMKKSSGENHPDYASSINNLAELYKATGEYDKAEQLYINSRDIRKRTLGETHPDYALSLNNLAALYEFTGQYELAEKLFVQAKEIIKKNLGEEHPYYVTALNNMAGMYQTIGNYAKAEPLYIQSMNIRLKMLGENHPGYAMSLNNLATLYQEIGQFQKAEPLYLQAKDIWKKSLGTEHPDYAMCINNLAALYEDNLQFEKAEPLYLQAKDIRYKVFGENHTDYATSLNNLAGLYTHMGAYKKAEPLLLSAMDIWKKVVGENNPIYATSLNNLAAFYRKAQIKYPEAERLYLQALALRKKLMGETHPLTADVQNDLALLYMNMGQPQKAEPLFLASSRTVMNNLQGTFPILSEKEKGNYITENLLYNECNSSFLYLFPRSAPAVTNNNLNLQLFFKSLSLADTRNMLEAVHGSKDTVIGRLFTQWQVVKAVLAKQYTLPADQRIKDLSRKEEEAENLEKELGRRSAAFRDQQVALQVTMKEVQQQLEEDEAAIEFVSFKLFNKKTTDSIIYGAYVYRKRDTAAQFVPLFEEQQFQRLLDSAGKSATVVANKFYRGIEVRDRSTSHPEKDLYKLVWLPLESKLAGIKKIAYSPSGKLYGIAFQALRIDSNTLLMDKYNLQQYTSTRQVALRKTSDVAVKPKSIVLFGNADFAMDSLQLSKLRNNGKYSSELTASVSSVAIRGSAAQGWPDLPGTAEEVMKIRDLFTKNKLGTKAYVQKEASEENLKTLSGTVTPQVIHIATHGFFLPEKTSGKKEEGVGRGNTYSLANDPLMRSGLILSGGNYAWSGKTPIDGVEDGIVTAYEISQLNLSSTELVVLSACETALGDIKGSEGVFGLQRAFKMAGVKKMIVSLWQVPDKETAELMTSFYSYWLGGKKIEAAFEQAQADMRKKYSPFYWAAFVLIE